jgi:hypothetical protein
MPETNGTTFLREMTEVEIPLVQHSSANVDPYNLNRYVKSDEDLKNLKNKQVKEFYKSQNEQIELFLSRPGQEQSEEETERLPYKIAVYGSFAANVTLFALQLAAAILSGSLALLATTADAFMDVASSTVLIVTGIIASRPNYVLYPTGKQKYKTVGIIVFSTLMATFSIQLLVESVKALLDGYRDLNVDGYTYAMVGIAFGNDM